MSGADLLALAAALLLIGAGAWQYRRRARDADNRGYGSQSGVLLIIAGVIVLVAAIGGLEETPAFLGGGR